VGCYQGAGSWTIDADEPATKHQMCERLVRSAGLCFTRATRLCLPRKRCVLSSGARSCRQPHGNHASNIIQSQLADREQPHTTAALWGC